MTSNCSICDAGKYQDVENKANSFCKFCPVGQYIDVDAFDQCKPNDAVDRDPFQHSSLGSCKTCPKGYEINGTDTTKCIICSFSSYQNENNKKNVKCKTCSANQYITDKRNEPAVHDSSEDCVACSSGQFAAAGARVCESCAAGKQQEESLCVDCVEGRFSTPRKSGNKKSTCEECPKGYYQLEKGTPYW